MGSKEVEMVSVNVFFFSRMDIRKNLGGGRRKGLERKSSANS